MPTKDAATTRTDAHDATPTGETLTTLLVALLLVGLVTALTIITAGVLH